MSPLFLAILVTLIPITLGMVLIVRSRHGGVSLPTCGQCGADISLVDGAAATCPACGAAFAGTVIVPGRTASRPALLAAGLCMIVLGAGCLTGALFTQRASVQAAREGEKAAEEARTRAKDAIEAAIARGRAAALENAETQPAEPVLTEMAPQADDTANDED